MTGKPLLIAAALLYAAVVGCALWPGGPGGAADKAALAGPPFTNSTRVTANVKGLPFRSATLQLQRTDWIDKYKVCIDALADRGFDTVLLVVDPRMENGKTSRIYLDLRRTPSSENLTALIRHAKGRNLRVMLMPIVLLDAPSGNEWRGSIKPESWEDWFASYREVITFYAVIAQNAGVDVLVVGSELVTSESKTEQWTRVIREVRHEFKGRLTYSANWDRYNTVPFWDQLDLIGMNSYWALDGGKKSKATVGDIKAAWAKIQGEVLPFAARKRKPVMFLEAGWCSIGNAAHEPWDYTRTEVPLDLDLQRRLYQGFFETWYGHPQLAGFSIWEWTPTGGGPDDRGYTPENKPAEKVLRDYLAKPAWKVDPGVTPPPPNSPADVNADQ